MDTPKWRDKRILLTGSTGSLGSEAALALARGGAELLLPVRNAEKAEQLKKKLLQACPEARLCFYRLDLADETDVSRCAEQIRSDGKPLDAIIHNAGIFTKGGKASPQGNELHRQVNALSPLLLTELLLPVLQRSSHPAVVTVTSLSAFWVGGASSNGRRTATRLYAQSKRQLMEDMIRLSAKYQDIRFVYAHPGVCATGLFTGSTHQTAYNHHLMKLILPLMKVIFPTPEKACASILTALEEALPGELVQPGGLLHIWGEPAKCDLKKKL